MRLKLVIFQIKLSDLPNSAWRRFVIEKQSNFHVYVNNNLVCTYFTLFYQVVLVLIVEAVALTTLSCQTSRKK